MGEDKKNKRLETVMMWGKCKYDPAFFIENFLQTFDKTKGNARRNTENGG